MKMGDTMTFPDDWKEFLDDYSFRDSKEVYTNGSMLIPAFRAEQMMDYYLAKAVREAVVHGRWVNRFNSSVYECSQCGTIGLPCWKGCPECLARMDGE